MTTPAQAVVARLKSPPPYDPEIASNWDRAPWRRLPELTLDHAMGEKPAHQPRVAAKLGWDADALYVIFRVEDRYVRAVAREHQQTVCTDSCVEYFFCPGEDVTKGYFNLEVNCGGTMLFNFQEKPRRNPVPVAIADLRQILVNRSMPHIVDPEIAEPVTWFVECRVPFSILEHYTAFTLPEPGSRWRANLYKCADSTSHPHWLTWSPIDRPRPDFHVPDQFGTLIFG